MRVSKRLIFGWIAFAHFAAVAAPNQRVDFEISDGPINSCTQSFAEVKESQLVATSSEHAQVITATGRVENSPAYNHFPKTLAFLSNQYNGRNVATRLNIANETELPEAYRIIAYMLNAGILKLNQGDSRSEYTTAWSITTRYRQLKKDIRSSEELALLQKSFAKQLKISGAKFKKYDHDIENLEFTHKAREQGADVLWVYDDVLRFNYSENIKGATMFYMFVMLAFVVAPTAVVDLTSVYTAPVPMVMGAFFTLPYVLAVLTTKFQQRSSNQLKSIFRTELNQALARERLQSTDSDDLPLSAELKSLPGAAQEQMLEDYETVADVAQLARRFAERAKRQIELSAQVSNSGPGKGDDLTDSLSAKLLAAHTELSAAAVEANAAMRLFLTYNHLSPDTKMCHPDLTCIKFNTILSGLIDPTVDLKSRIINISKALNLARYLISKLNEAIEQYTDLRVASRKLISEAESQITKIEVNEKTREEIENLRSRIAIIKNNLNEYEKMGLQLKEYLRNAKVFEAQLLELRKNPNGHLINSLRIEPSR